MSGNEHEEAFLLPHEEAQNGHRTPDDAKASAYQRFKAMMSQPTPLSMISAVLIVGICCGVVAWVYNSVLNAVMTFTWAWVPRHVVLPAWQKSSFGTTAHEWVLSGYVVLICTAFGLIAGVAQRLLGSPGDLPDTVGAFHKMGYVPYWQAPSMFIVSLFSVSAGGSLGPEAPILTLCASSVAFLWKKYLQVEDVMMRYSSLLGMSAGLAAFFGVGIGGSLFALEVPHRMGLEYFEVVSYSVAAGLVCISVFRGLSFEPFGAIWEFSTVLLRVDTRHVMLGIAVGVLTALIAIVWTYFTKWLKQLLARVGLDEHKTPVACGLLGGLIIGLLGAALPPVLFWGEFELKTLADDSIPLAHIWPKGGIWGLQPFMQREYTAGIYALIGATKMLAISVTLIAGFRGGFIFPLMFSGTALGSAMRLVVPESILSSEAFPTVLFAMTFAAGLNTAITRTPLATTVILATLSGQPDVSSPCLSAAIVALVLTRTVPFIMTQQSRPDKITALSSSSHKIVHGEAAVPRAHENVLDQVVFEHSSV